MAAPQAILGRRFASRSVLSLPASSPKTYNEYCAATVVTPRTTKLTPPSPATMLVGLIHAMRGDPASQVGRDLQGHLDQGD